MLHIALNGYGLGTDQVQNISVLGFVAYRRHEKGTPMCNKSKYSTKLSVRGHVAYRRREKGTPMCNKNKYSLLHIAGAKGVHRCATKVETYFVYTYSKLFILCSPRVSGSLDGMGSGR